MSVFKLSPREQQELHDRLKELRDIWEKHPVPPELTNEEKKERIKKIREKRKLSASVQG